MLAQSRLSGTGTLRVDGTGSVTMANGGNTQGTLTMGAAGAALNVGTGNFTIRSDYTNAAAGTGDGFNRRAGVSGTGQIVAGGDVAQVITGAGVTNGNTRQRHADHRQPARGHQQLRVPHHQRRHHRPDAARRDPDRRQRAATSPTPACRVRA